MKIINKMDEYIIKRERERERVVEALAISCYNKHQIVFLASALTWDTLDPLNQYTSLWCGGLIR